MVYTTLIYMYIDINEYEGRRVLSLIVHCNTLVNSLLCPATRHMSYVTCHIQFPHLVFHPGGGA